MSRLPLLLIVWLGLGAVVPGARAQHVVEGRVVDAATGAPLSAASIRVEGAFRSTITNDEGQYRLRFDSLAATLVVRHIGYEIRRFSLVNAAEAPRSIRLQAAEPPKAAADAEPAAAIMRKVIQYKKQWRSILESYRAEAYTRFTLADDTSIVLIEEATSDIFWDRQRGTREVITARQRPAHATTGFSLATASYIPNFYDDEINIGGFRFIGPTHPQALRYYEVERVGRSALGDRVVYEIALTPKTTLQPTFEGIVRVVKEPYYAMIGVELRPNEAMIFPPPVQAVDVTYRQQFGNFGAHFWLPLDVRIEGRLTAGMPGLWFPAFRYQQCSRLLDYALNVPLPDSLYQRENVLRVDTAAVRADTLLATAVPRSKREQRAYARLKDRAPPDVFEPTGPLTLLGPLRRFVDLGVEEVQADAQENRQPESSSFQARLRRRSRLLRPQLWYNRVEGAHLALAPRLALIDRLTLTGMGGYMTGLQDTPPSPWTYGGELAVRVGPDERGALSVSYQNGVEPRYGRGGEGALLANGISMLTGDADYFDYFKNERWRVGASWRVPSIDTRFSVRFNDEQHTSVPWTTGFDLRAGWNDNFLVNLLLGSDDPQRLRNTMIEEGRLRSVMVQVEWKDGSRPLGIAGQRGVKLTLERSAREGLGSDFSFTQIRASANWRFTTFLERRLLPNTLDVYAIAGGFIGRLPLQRFGTVPGKLAPFTSFGVLRTLENRPYEGEKYGAVFWEHNFRTVPFELLGLDWLARRGLSLVVHGAHGYSWIDGRRLAELRERFGYDPRIPDELHHELGLSLNGILSYVRLDATKRLTEPGFDWGLSVARIF